MKEIIKFRGHPNIRATHKTTLEVTKEGWLTIRGDCIIGVSADKSCSDLSPKFKELLRKGSKLKITIKVEEKQFQFSAYGDPRLELTDPTSVVIRKSDFISPRTLAVKSEAAASDVPREIVELLKKEKKGVLIVEAIS